MARAGIKIPSVNQVLSLGVTLLVLLAILRFMPEQFKTWFRL